MLRHWLSTGFIKAAMVAAGCLLFFFPLGAQEGGDAAQGGPITAGVESGAGGLGGASGADTGSANDNEFSLSFLFGGYLGNFRYKTGFLSDEIRGILDYDDGFFDFTIDFSLLNDDKYGTDSVFLLGHYFDFNDCTAGFAYGDLSLSGGRGIHTDVVDTPYSVYISSAEIPSLFLDLAYDSERFLYETRWIELNARSRNTYTGTDIAYADRGMTYKVFALNMGDLRFGYQDAYVYLNRSFDAESFLCPLPMFFLELIKTAAGRPWREVNNPNSLMGFFVDIKKPDWYFESQLLVDDINASALKYILGDLIPALNNIENLSKLAWSAGGRYRFPFGTIGFYHGGATKYTFEATYTSKSNPSWYDEETAPYYSVLPYEYCYYPATTYFSGSTERTISYIDSYIGYKYGENNIAFLVDYENVFFGGTKYEFDLYGSLEYVISGSKSPANPWHEYDSWLEIEVPVELLSDDVLEHTLALTVSASKRIGAWGFSLYAELGYVWNELGLVETEAGSAEPKIWRPIEGSDRFISGVSLTASYLIDLTGKED
jgi:hypothetical protein